MVDVRREGSAFDALDLKLKQLSGWEGRTGFFEDARYPGGQQVAGIAAIQEFGLPSKNIPPRPFFRPAIHENKQRWMKFAEGIASRVLAGKMTAQDAMEALASLAAEDIKQAIANVWWPKLSDRTLRARRAKGNTSDKPLIDSKLMVRSVEGRAFKE